jgi:ABC-type antimicrobial peptide transport system permease subunit
MAGFTEFGQSLISASLVDPTIIKHGALPEVGQVAISLLQYQTLYMSLVPTGEFPKTYTLGAMSLIISGVYESEDLESQMIINAADVNKRSYEQSFGFHVFSDNPSELIDRLDENNIRGFDVYQIAYDNAKDQQNLVLISTVTSSSILLGFAALGFYFVIRSSLISRIYEVSVFRALGVKKGDIFRSFLVEIFVLTTISTFIGYVLASVALMQLQDGLLGQFNFFKVTPLTFLLGIVLSYAINVLAGIFPVALLLNKTPAQILSQYDI